MSEYQHLGLRDWPFSVVPSEHSAAAWIGRPDFERKLRGLLRTVRRVGTSRIILLWAAFGAGKTHALLHLKHLATADESLAPLYVVTPKGIRSFLDVFRAIVESALSEGLLERLGLALYRRLGPAGGSTDLERGLIRLVALEEPQTRFVLAWLKAEKVGIRDLRNSGITSRLEGSADAVETLNELIDLVRRELGLKVLLMLDEIQELGELSVRQHQEAVGGLHKVFDRNTEGLTLVLSFTTGSQKTVARIIGDTLFERRSETLNLPALNQADAVDFVVELIAAHSVAPDKAPFPFDRAAVEAVVAQLAVAHGDLTPRQLIRTFDLILRDADMDIEDGELTSIDADYALARLDVQAE